MSKTIWKEEGFFGTLSFFILIILIFCGWFFSETEHKHRRGYIVAAYYHEYDRYSVMTMNENKTLESVSNPDSHAIPTTVFTDVKDGESPWFEYSYYHNPFSGVETNKERFIYETLMI